MSINSEKPNVFIGSSSESINIANLLLSSLKKWSNPKLWNTVFTPSKVTIDILLNEIPKYDLCVFLWTEDDELSCRGEKFKVTRDNVIFETGISHGIKGRDLTFIVTIGDVKVISDLEGVTYIKYQTGESMDVASGMIKNAFNNWIENCKETENKDNYINNKNVKRIDFSRAKQRRAQSGFGIIDELNEHMLNDDRDAFVETLCKVEENNSSITQDSFLEIANMCTQMKLAEYALEITEFACEKFKRSEALKVKLIDVLIRVGLGDYECQEKAQALMEEFFCIKNDDNGLPRFTSESKKKRLLENNYDRIITVFTVYLVENRYECILSLIDSMSEIGIDSSDVFISGYKAQALSECGNNEEARKIYEGIVPDNPNDKRLIRLANVLINCNEKIKGYRLFELNAINYYDASSLIMLAEKIHQIQLCRTFSNTYVNTEFNHNASKKVIVPILFKAIEKSPFDTTLKEVKKILTIIGAREEYDFIKQNEHTPYAIYTNLKTERFEAYTWDTIEYIECENIAEKNVGDAAIEFRKQILEILKEESSTTNIE